MKRFLTILAAVMVIFAIAGCDNGTTGGKKGGGGGNGGGGNGNGGNGGGEPAVVFSLSEALADLALGAITETDLETAVPGFAFAGSPTVEVIENSPRALKITTNANWGEGLDLKNSEFEFTAGDVITIQGKYDTAGTDGGASWATPLVMLRIDTGSNDPTKTHSTTGDYEFTHTLTASDVKAIKATGENNPANIRIAGRGVGTIFTISEITITRKAGSGGDNGGNGDGDGNGVDADVTDGLKKVALVRDNGGDAALGHWLNLNSAEGAFNLAAQTITLSGMTADWNGLDVQKGNDVFKTSGSFSISDGDRFVVRGTGTAGSKVQFHSGSAGLKTGTIDEAGDFEIVFDPNTAQVAAMNAITTDGGIIIRVAPGASADVGNDIVITEIWFGTPDTN